MFAFDFRRFVKSFVQMKKEKRKRQKFMCHDEAHKIIEANSVPYRKCMGSVTGNGQYKFFFFFWILSLNNLHDFFPACGFCMEAGVRLCAGKEGRIVYVCCYVYTI